MALAMQRKAQRCYESQSRQLKNEGEKVASYGPVLSVQLLGRTHFRIPNWICLWSYYHPIHESIS